MNRLDTPLGPDARAAKAAAGPAGKDQLKRMLAGERDERGSAFGALLKRLDQKKPDGEVAAEKAQKPDAAARAAAADDAARTVEDILAAAAPAATDGAQPAAVAATPLNPVDSAAARLLLGTLQPAEGAVPEPRKDAQDASGASLAGRAGALADAVGEMARTISRESHAGRFTRPDQPAGREAGGIALPTQDTTPVPDLSLLARLADALKDSAAQADDRSSSLAADARAGDGKAATSARGSETAAPLTIAVTHQETHLPPVLKLSPFQQVVEPIRQAAAELVASSRTADAIPELDSARPTEISAPTKLLHLELRPVELGTITVKLRLSQGGMEMRIEASKAETATMLGQDKEALREIIRASGYSPDTVSVEAVHIDATAGDWQRAQHRQDGTQQQTSDGREGGRGFNEFRQGEQGREGPRQGWSPDAPLGKDEPHDMAEAGRPGGAPHLYL